MKPWLFRVEAKADSEDIEIRVYDDIGSRMGPGCVSAQHVIDALAAAPEAKRVNLRINSSGGLVSEATTIWNRLAEHKANGGEIVAYVDGVAASAAAYLTTVADRVVMPDNAFLMIHKARAGQFGTDADMESARHALASANEMMAEAFATGSERRARGKTKGDFMDVMGVADRYFRASEAIEWGLADEKVASIKAVAHAHVISLDGAEWTAVPADLRAAPYVLAKAEPIEPTPPSGGQQTRTTGKESETMDLKVLAKILGLAETATADEVSAELTERLKPQASVNVSGMKMLGVATEAEATAKVQEFQRSVLQLLGATGKATTAEALGVMLEWKTKADQADTLVKQVAALTEGERVAKRDAAIEKLSREGNLPPARHEWARAQFATAESVETFCQGMPKGFFGAITEPEKGESLTLTAEERGICKTLGMTEAAYLEEKKLLRKAG